MAQAYGTLRGVSTAFPSQDHPDVRRQRFVDDVISRFKLASRMRDHSSSAAESERAGLDWAIALVAPSSEEVGRVFRYVEMAGIAWPSLVILPEGDASVRKKFQHRDELGASPRVEEGVNFVVDARAFLRNDRTRLGVGDVADLGGLANEDALAVGLVSENEAFNRGVAEDPEVADGLDASGHLYTVDKQVRVGEASVHENVSSVGDGDDAPASSWVGTSEPTEETPSAEGVA